MYSSAYMCMCWLTLLLEPLIAVQLLVSLGLQLDYMANIIFPCLRPLATPCSVFGGLRRKKANLEPRTSNLEPRLSCCLPRTPHGSQKLSLPPTSLFSSQLASCLTFYKQILFSSFYEHISLSHSLEDNYSFYQHSHLYTYCPSIVSIQLFHRTQR